VRTAKFWQACAIALQRAEVPSTRGTVNISLPDLLREFADEQVAQGSYGTSGE